MTVERITAVELEQVLARHDSIPQEPLDETCPDCLPRSRCHACEDDHNYAQWKDEL